MWSSTNYDAASAALTRQLVLQYISGTVKAGGEMPNFGVCGLGTWTLLARGLEPWLQGLGVLDAINATAGPSAARL